MTWRGLIAGVAAALLWASAVQAETVLHRGNGTEPETLDIHRSSGDPESNIQRDLFEGLLMPDADARPVAAAAESWTISPDGLTYTFKLRADGTWSDGTPVTAADFAFAWRRLVAPETNSRYAYFLWPVKNAEAISKGKLPPEAMGVAAPDPRTFVVTLEAPAAWFLSSLAHHTTYPLQRANVGRFGTDYIRPGNLVSNGPYLLAEAVPQGHIKLVKNPRFHAAASVAIDTVYYYPTENQDSELKRFRAGELDITYDAPDSQLPWLRENMPGELRIHPYFATYFYIINMTVEPWKSSPALRRALVLAIDRQIITDKISRGGETPAFALVPPSTAGHRAVEPEWAGWTQAERDAEAKRLVAEAGYGPVGKPLMFELMYNTSENHRKIAIALAAMWQQKLGARVTLVNQEWKVFLSTRERRAYKALVRQGWIGDYDDAHSFLTLFRSDVGSQNASGYADPEFDRLLQAASATADGERRARLLQQAEAKLVADTPFIPIYTYATKHMVSARVEGWRGNVLDQHPTRYLRLKP